MKKEVSDLAKLSRDQLLQESTTMYTVYNNQITTEKLGFTTVILYIQGIHVFRYFWNVT